MTARTAGFVAGCIWSFLLGQWLGVLYKMGIFSFLEGLTVAALGGFLVGLLAEWLSRFFFD